MNVPIGEPVKKMEKLDQEKVINDLHEFMGKRENGYLVYVAEGKHTMVEGFLAIEAGSITGASFYYLKYEKRINSSDALKRVMSYIASNKGIYSIYKWKAQQLELFKVFNEDCLFLEPITVMKLPTTPITFTDYEEEDLKELLNKEETKEEIMDKYKISDIKKKEKPVEEEMAEDIKKAAISEHKQLESMINDYLKESEKKVEPKMEKPPVSGEGYPVGHGIEKFKKITLKEKKEGE